MSVLGDRIKNAEKSADRRTCSFELDGETVVIYASPLTGRDFDRIAKAHPDFVSNPSVSSQVDMIIMKAEMVDGEPAFDKIDKMTLVRQPLGWIMDIRKQLFNDDEDFSEDRVEEDEKN